MTAAIDSPALAMRRAVDALAAVPRELDAVRALDDTELLDLTRLAAVEVRLAQVHVSLLAGEIARRSAPELGHSGLAQRTGHRTPDELVRVTTGSRLADARAAVRVGIAAGAESPSVLGAAVLDGQVSVAVADAIATGLGPASGDVTDADLDRAAVQLIARVSGRSDGNGVEGDGVAGGDGAGSGSPFGDLGGGLDADRVAREARALRDELDADGIRDREALRRSQRSLRIGRRADGMGFANWVLDPETFAVVSEAYDRMTSPRRGGPSFVADNDREQAEHILRDSRTTAQLASDGFAELLRQGAAADTSALLGDGPIGVRVLVAARVLPPPVTAESDAAEVSDTRSHGGGYLEGHHDPVSLETVERHACAAGTVTITVDSTADNAGQPLNLGRERRLFSRAQRLALAARDGGCRWPGCERPPSWCEAHHIEHWSRDGGRTDVADGLLLCRHHHMLVHNNGWEISRAGPLYLAMPPGGSARDELRMLSTSRALHDALHDTLSS